MQHLLHSHCFCRNVPLPPRPQTSCARKDAGGLHLKAALQEHQSTASRQYFLIVELEAALLQSNRDKAAEVEARK